MNYNDGMEVLWQSTQTLHLSTPTSHGHTAKNTFKQLWGQRQALFIVLLLITPVFTKPLTSSSLLASSPSVNQHRDKDQQQQHQRRSSQKTTSSIQKSSSQLGPQKTLTDQQENINSLQGSLNTLKQLPKYFNSLVSSSENSIISSIDKKSSNVNTDSSELLSSPHSRFHITNFSGDEYLNALRAIDLSLRINSVDTDNHKESSVLYKKNTKYSSLEKFLRNTKDIWRVSEEKFVVHRKDQQVASSPKSESNIAAAPPAAETVPTAPAPLVSRVVRNTAEPRTVVEGSLVGMDTGDSSRADGPHWSLPCRIDDSPNAESTPPMLSQFIYNSVNVAHKHVHRFKNSFANQMWDGLDWDNAVLMVGSQSFDFLNQLDIPTEDQLQSMEFNEVLRVAYESMQRRAVSIEQATLDQALYRDVNYTDFLNEFRKIEGEIVNILCELHYAMKQQNVHASVEITAEIMEPKYRDVDSSSDRLARDTIILREYINGLDYLMKVFGHFKSQTT